MSKSFQEVPYLEFKKAIPSYLCDKIIEEGASKNLNIATVKNKDTPDFKRNTEVSWFDYSHYISGLMFHYGNIGNRLCYNFDIDSPSKATQFGKYTKDSFYTSHVDTDFWGDGMRKLSVVCVLSKRKDYTGGDFYLERIEKKYVDFEEQGTIIVFPSSTIHGVEKVKSGTRYSLVSWLTGPKIK